MLQEGAGSTTAATIASGVTVAQFDRGGVPEYVVRTPDNNYSTISISK